MSSPLSAAIAARRKPAQLPSEEMAPEQTEAQEGESKVAALLASLAPEEKQELYALLESEMSDTAENAESDQSAPEAMTDAKGVLKSTPGEQEALAQEGIGGEEMPDDSGGNSFLKYARRNIANLTKQGKLK